MPHSHALVYILYRQLSKFTEQGSSHTHLGESLCPHTEVGACAGGVAQGVTAWQHILEELQAGHDSVIVQKEGCQGWVFAHVITFAAAAAATTIHALPKTAAAKGTSHGHMGSCDREVTCRLMLFQMSALGWMLLNAWGVRHSDTSSSHMTSSTW